MKRKIKKGRSHCLCVSGFTLIEVMASATMLILALSGTLSGMSAVLKIHNNSQRSGVALHIAETELETLLVARQADARLDLGTRSSRYFSKEGKEGSGNTFELITNVKPHASVDIKEVKVTVKWKNLETLRQVSFKTLRP